MKSLTCEQVRELLAAEELSLASAPDAKDACERHLVSCASCRQALLDGKELSELLESSLTEYTRGADELAERIAAELPAQQVDASYWRSRVFRLDAVAAVLLFGAGLFVGWWLQQGPAPASPAGDGAPAPMVAPMMPQVVGSRGTIAHELLPSDRVRTFGQRRIIVVDPRQPDVIIEVYRSSVLEDNVPLRSPTGGGQELPVE